MTRGGLILGALLLWCAAASTPAATAQAPDDLAVRIERDLRPGALSSELVVNLKITVTDRPTGRAPEQRLEVYAFADEPAGSRTDFFPCAHEHDNSPEVPRGVYLCTVLVDHGGRWRFSGVVNGLRANADAVPVTLARSTIELDIVSAEVAPSALPVRIKGRAVEVALLWSHAAAAGGWLVGTALAAFLALPALRRRLSTDGVHRLEDRFDAIVKATWVATGLLVASGTYLLVNQTAYDTPLSPARMDAVFRLPYGKPYFLALAAKLALYGAMLAASALLLTEARRQRRAGSPAGETSPPLLIRLSTTTLVAGAVGVSVSITLLKYFHELIEATRALL